MSASFITQCPHCLTSFRVNQAQLGAANGAVRCGACLKVFNAPQHMLGGTARSGGEPIQPPAAAPKPAAPAAPSEPPRPVSAPGVATLGWPLAPHSARPSADSTMAPAATPAPAPIPAPAPAPAAPPPAEEAPAAAKPTDDTLWIHDDLDLDSLNLDEELAKLDEFELSQEFRELQSAPKPAEALLGNRPVVRDPHDERWAEALLRDEERQANEGGRQEPSLGRIDAEAEQPSVAPPQAQPAPVEEPAVAAAVEEEEDDDLPSFSARRDDEPLEALEAEATEQDEEPEAEPPLMSRETPRLGTPPDEDEEDREPLRPDPGLGETALRDLSDEPLQLDWQKPKSRWGRRLLWLLLILLALAGLGGQYVAYHFDELAREDAYRPWFAELCPQLGCTLPSKVDVEQIRSSNLVVRSHPDFSGALVVDAIIYNRASFSQPFPLLELRFADLNGQLIASRSFKPSEYLGGELAGRSEMPPQTPIHVSLDILDPGPKAVNYSLSFHSPE
ncbi:DUF3426 domain-containing protein [Pseudomonas citronellolis]|uniref:DUF3426 domain-containing protein n=1 Tax=Pseudomonas citronellolis TaxID=53408 RepID=UPI0021130B2B|nr:DUF3426 domain-containing protein [Pseudomonas citronellolis]UUC49727.1 DUF3426 domain-containing protein [Pseudomonas citronellolis]